MGIMNILEALGVVEPEEEPLYRYEQELRVHIKDAKEPFERVLAFEDADYDGWIIRCDIEAEVKEWISYRAKVGIQMEDVWYPPHKIDRIEISKCSRTLI